MKIAVLGAGAVGCYYGGMLARAGHEVALIGRPAHVEAIRRDGLRFETRAFDERIRAAASADPAAVKGAELVLFCVKSTDTDAAAAQLAPHLSPSALVLNLQNGVDNAERIQARVPCAVIPAAVYVATEMAGPGHLRHHGRGELVLGVLPGTELPGVEGRLSELKTTFEAAGVPLKISDNVAGALWEKLVANCAYNAISAIAQLPYGEMVRGAGVRALMDDLIEETLAVAAARGIRMAPEVRDNVRRIAETMPTQYSSTAQDLARGRATEIDHLNGYVARQGEAFGVPVPANRAVWALVKLLASKNEG